MTTPAPATKPVTQDVSTVLAPLVAYVSPTMVLTALAPRRSATDTSHAMSFDNIRLFAGGIDAELSQLPYVRHDLPPGPGIDPPQVVRYETPQGELTRIVFLDRPAKPLRYLWRPASPEGTQLPPTEIYPLRSNYFSLFERKGSLYLGAHQRKLVYLGQTREALGGKPQLIGITVPVGWEAYPHLGAEFYIGDAEEGVLHRQLVESRHVVKGRPGEYTLSIANEHFSISRIGDDGTLRPAFWNRRPLDELSTDLFIGTIESDGVLHVGTP